MPARTVPRCPPRPHDSRRERYLEVTLDVPGWRQAVTPPEPVAWFVDGQRCRLNGAIGHGPTRNRGDGSSCDEHLVHGGAHKRKTRVESLGALRKYFATLHAPCAQQAQAVAPCRASWARPGDVLLPGKQNCRFRLC